MEIRKIALAGLVTLALGCSSSAPRTETRYVLNLGSTNYVLKLPTPVEGSTRETSRMPVLKGNYNGNVQVAKPDTSDFNMPNARPDD